MQKITRAMRLPGRVLANLPEALAQRPAHWHPDGPPVLDGGDVLTDLAALLDRQAFEPVADRLSAGRRPIECRGDLLQGLSVNTRYQKWYTLSRVAQLSGSEPIGWSAPACASRSIIHSIRR